MKHCGVAVKILCVAIFPFSAGWEDVQSEPFLSVISAEVWFCARVLVTPLPLSSDSTSLLSLAINAVRADDEFEEPNGVSAFS